ncbi:DNA cytosine methyltransferase [Hymenobacter sp. BT635]|uniref:Cytosine-specific methyltransferase n=1 Tax=Hymenobacter nitidus TaxID=2880929 RepID=A0ABS8AL98_9BACT|nr:DNA cytosine methyltransferase [Hymenobacter nitidus]MCB2380442.1 DNA cytosine methyltransferase [Hymenobacter nitidus]
MRFIDLFAGLGGFHVGLEQLGMECVFASELNKDLRALYRHNYGLADELVRGDIREVNVHDIPAHDMLCAGFPCQPFSKAGAQAGMKDEVRGNLFYEIMRIVEHHQPTYLLLENVANLLKHDKQNTWRVIKETLEATGYEVSHKILSPHQFGVPQLRQRMFIVAARRASGGLSQFAWPKTENQPDISVRSILDDIPDETRALTQREIDAIAVWQEFLDCLPEDAPLPSFPIWATEYQATYPFETEVPYMLSREQLGKYKGIFGKRLDRKKAKQQERIPTYARGEVVFPKWKQQFIASNRAFFERYKNELKPVMKKIRKLPFSWQKFEWNCQGAPRHLDQLLFQFRPSGIRVKHPTYFPALVSSTTTQVPVIGWLNRYITASEGAKLQSLGGISLPSNNTAAFRALGNAVNAEVVRQVAACLIGPSQSKPAQQWLDLSSIPTLAVL